MKPTEPENQDRIRRCIKCMVAEACPEYTINKDMAYCEDCAHLLKLGESKEGRPLAGIPPGNGHGRKPPPEALGEGAEPDIIPIGEVPATEPG